MMLFLVLILDEKLNLSQPMRTQGLECVVHRLDPDERSNQVGGRDEENR